MWKCLRLQVLIVDKTYAGLFFPGVEDFVQIALEVGVVNLISGTEYFYQMFFCIGRNTHLGVQERNLT